MTTTGWILLFVFARLIDLVIWYFLNRGSVRANDQIAMLKEISEKQSAQIDLLIALANKKEEPEKDYLEEARKKAGLI
ncbi:MULTISPECIES: YebO family protein [Klebsiella]|uniref:YebO family protein n=1 Tax=Klebsiella TaxID=570 RepID=UPI002404CE56|nr:YebO family protein [Klebsiella pneumoniae]MDG0574176.1 YebO family protein [Klebsiella pneumoniae]